MTLDEAIAQEREKADKNSGCWKRCTSIRDCKTCEQEHEQLAEWLEELKEYRKIGTPDEFKQLKENGAFTGVELAQLAAMQMKLKEYQVIGTVEECRAAVEKQKEKKPICNDLCTCPSCGTHNDVIKKRRNTVAFDTVYCWHCGQAIKIDRLE